MVPDQAVTRRRRPARSRACLPRRRGAQAVEDHDHLGDLVHQHHRRKPQDAKEGEREQGGDDQQRQDDVLVDDAPPPTGMGERAREKPQIVTGEGHVGRLDRGVGARRAHRDPDVRGGQRGGVVDAVADHRDRAVLPTEFADRSGLVFGAQLGADVIDPCMRSEGAGGAGVVAGEHGDPDALRGEGTDDLGDLGAQLVADADRGDRDAAAVDDHDRHALLFQACDLVAEESGVEPTGAADGDPRAGELAFDAVPGLLGHALRRRSARRCGGDRGGEG
ncbi:unnamed protein product, partial [Penicillium discolor]